MTSNNKRVLFFLRSLDRGGTEKQLYYLARGLKERGVQVAVLTFYSEGTLTQEFLNLGVPVHSLKKAGRWDIFPFLGRFSAFVRKFSPDVLYSLLVDANVFAALLRVFSRRIRLVWGIRTSFIDFSRYDWSARFNFRLSALISRVADTIVFNSYRGQNFHLEHGFGGGRAVVVQNGIDTGFFRPDEDLRKKTRRELGLGDEDVLIGHVGRLDPMKDHPTFVRAASIVAGACEHAHFLCVGRGDWESQRRLMEMTNFPKLGDRLRFLDEKDDLRPFYNAFDLLVSSSIGEGFPNVIGEAMSCGLRCVATDVGDSRHLVGDSGVVVAPRDPEALARGILQFLEPGDSGLSSPRTRIVENFSLGKMILSTELALFP